MKKRVITYVAGACVAGMVVGAPGVAAADTASSGEAVQAGWAASGEMNVALYGPPSMFEDPAKEPVQVLYGPPPFEDPAEEPIQLLYGPPVIEVLDENPMTAEAVTRSVKAKRLAIAGKKFKRAIVVKDAVGTVRFARVAEGSSKRLSVGKKTGYITVKKGTKPGVYKVKVAVTASGDDRYAPATKTVVVKVRVK